MCDAKSTNFFRPWNVAESSDAPTLANTRDTTEDRTSPVIVKQEEDNESVVSTSTSEENSTASLSENDASSVRVTRRRLRRRSGSSTEETISRSCSVNSENASGGSSLDRLSNFVFSSPQISNFSVASIIREDASNSQEVSFPVANGCCPTATYPVDYLQRMALQHVHNFGPLNGSPSLMPMDVGAAAIQASTISTTGQPFFCEFPGVHHIPQGLYAPSMEQAVTMIHRQDAVEKQLKKLRPKKFRCEHCDVAFSNNGQLKGHIRIHTGERPFKCDAEGCGKSFTRNEELTRHKRIHTGLRPHACIVCGKRFGRKDHLKKHTRTHENRDPYRVSAAALGVFALGHAIPRGHPFPPYVYPI